MKQWMKKLSDQFSIGWEGKTHSNETTDAPKLSEIQATLLYVVDVMSKYLIDLENRPARDVRMNLEDLAQGIMSPDISRREKSLFRFRQFFNSYRIDEYTYIQNTFDDFKNVIWDFADQLSEDTKYDQSQDLELFQSLESLRDAVEANSIEDLRAKSREFIDFYVEVQSHREARRTRRYDHIQQNLEEVRHKLSEVTKSAQTDHLTGAWNRRAFDEQLRQQIHAFNEKSQDCSLVILDIDYFKRINDVFGHDVGDFVIQECVRVLKSVYCRESDFIARIGGEEFAVILPNYKIQDAAKKAEIALKSIRDEIIVHSDKEIRFTCSMGIAQLLDMEDRDEWVKRADQALYKSKESGRDRYTLAPNTTAVKNLAS